MSRVIKFRAWTMDGMITPYSWVNDSNMFGQRMSPSPIKPLMQFTGLYDKSGVEIYEGDIVEDHNGIGEVEYVDRHASFRVNYRNGRAKWFYDYNLKGERESIEVIGNIYENKELL